jgi:nitroreductase
VQNILLACRDLGLGSTLTTMHQMFEAELHARFGIPNEYGVVVMMPVGFPAGNFGPVRRRPAEACAGFDHFGASEPATWNGVDGDA